MRLSDALSAGCGELIKLDLSFCGLIHQDLETICKNNSFVRSVTDLNISGNSFGSEVFISFRLLYTKHGYSLLFSNRNINIIDVSDSLLA